MSDLVPRLFQEWEHLPRAEAASPSGHNFAGLAGQSGAIASIGKGTAMRRLLSVTAMIVMTSSAVAADRIVTLDDAALALATITVASNQCPELRPNMANFGADVAAAKLDITQLSGKGSHAAKVAAAYDRLTPEAISAPAAWCKAAASSRYLLPK